MASSSKTINMPLIFVISIGATVSLVAITMFGLAWYEYESRVVLREQVIDGPTHDDTYERRRAEQEANLGDIESAILSVAAEHTADKPAGHEGHGE
ncbi:MAG: hypothetical protein AAGB26_09935 [Planctomycetota bacterium]